MRDLIPVNKSQFTSLSRPYRDRQRGVLESFLAMEPVELVTTFVLICRALGFNARIILNFDITPLKPPVESLQVKPVKPEPSPPPVKEEVKGKSKSKKSLSAKISEKSKRASSRSISAKLSEAVKRKSSVSKPITTSVSAKQREDEMIKKINKKFPTKKEEKVEHEMASTSRNKKSSEGQESSKGKGSKSSKSTNLICKLHYWSEVYLEVEKKWVCVDLETGRVNSPPDIESKLTKPLYYIVSIDNMGNMKVS